MKLQDISPAEIYVLSIIYECGKADVYEILEKVTKEWKYTTVLTLVTRLFTKGHVERKKLGKRFIYSPKFSKNDSFQMIMDRFFGTTLLVDPNPMIKYLSQSKKFNREQKKLLAGLAASK